MIAARNTTVNRQYSLGPVLFFVLNTKPIEPSERDGKWGTLQGANTYHLHEAQHISALLLE
jgi:hypothetical protein